MRNALLACIALTVALHCEAADPTFTVVSVDTASEQLQTFYGDAQGQPFKHFDPLVDGLHAKGKQLTFAMNAGMYHPDLSPVGLLVIDGRQVAPLNTSAGSGNFFLKPNGVFLLSRSGPRIVETGEYPALSEGVRFATQSGPLSLRRGVVHPAFNPRSTSRLVRNGVGVSGQTAYFVLSERPVSFHELAVFFRDTLHCDDALYLDGVVSSLYSTALRRNDRKADLGPMVGVVVNEATDAAAVHSRPGQPATAPPARP